MKQFYAKLEKMNRAERRQTIKKVNDTIGNIKAIEHELKNMSLADWIDKAREKRLKRALYANHKFLVSVGLYTKPGLWARIKAKIRGKFKRK